MSMLFGRWQFDGSPVDREDLEHMDSELATYGPDGRRFYAMRGITVGCRLFLTTPDARHNQPFVSPSGALVTWDGRLDNRQELIAELRGEVNRSDSDVEIVAAAYSSWGTESFGKFIGDWALVIWDLTDQTLLLGVDFVGARHLYYKQDSDRITWSTILDPLVRDREQGLLLSEEYLAGWISCFPPAQLTPFHEIQAVVPGTYVSIHNRAQASRKYWRFDPDKITRYASDREYEEQFRQLFAQAVRRRLSSKHPVVAELSGGMDSSAIVCMADDLLAREQGLTPRLDTVSYYSNQEPNWDDPAYFTIVEEKRKRTGCHIEVGSTETVEIEQSPTNGFAAIPAVLLRSSKAREEFEECVRTRGNRVLLSGIGGDEVLGGVPTPIPELADLLAAGRLPNLLQRAVAWALVQRKPVLHLLYQTCREFLPSSATDHLPSWLTPQLVNKLHSANGSAGRIRFFGSRPSFQHNLSALDMLQRQLGCSPLSSNPRLETRYPYLDRDLLEFLFSIPREQVTRPGERRSLMRRALKGIVPDQVLSRKRKAFVVRTPLSAVSAYWRELTAQNTPLISETLGLIDRQRFSESLSAVLDGNGGQLFQLSRTLILELWLRHIRGASVLGNKSKFANWSEVVGIKKLS